MHQFLSLRFVILRIMTKGTCECLGINFVPMSNNDPKQHKTCRKRKPSSQNEWNKDGGGNEEEIKDTSSDIECLDNDLAAYCHEITQQLR